jgi:hypothetical protein
MIPAEDWLAELDAKIAGLERDLALDSRPGSESGAFNPAGRRVPLAGKTAAPSQ